MAGKVSVTGLARRLKAESKQQIRSDRKVVKDAARDVKKPTGIKQVSGVPTTDSFVNFMQQIGVGADNPLTSAGYGFNPITRIRTMLEWIHRGSWIGGVAVDVLADDMTQMGVEIQSDIAPDKIAAIEAEAVRLEIWQRLCESIKWGRLYGGGLAVMMVDGQAYDKPLRLETIGKDQFKGLLVLDRWMVDPSLNDLVTTPGPALGLPKYYTVTADAPFLRKMKVHHSRCFRFTGIELPYWQRVMENLWSISIYERIYDRMIAFDSATTGAAQLVYKAWIRTYKIKGLRGVIAAGGQPLAGLTKFVDVIRRFQGIEGMTLLDGEDEMEAMQSPTFTGLTDCLIHFGQQLSGALQIPLVRLFGQSPAGLNSTGESDLRMYYDGIKKLQETSLRTPVTSIYLALAQSLGIRIPKGAFKIQFRSLWQLDEEKKATIAGLITTAITGAEEGGLITQQGAMKELKQSSHITGIYTNIQDEDIEAAEETLPPAGEEAMKHEQEMATLASKAESKKPAGKAKDSLGSVIAMKRLHDLDLVIENQKGSTRHGPGWDAVMPADYGYIRRTVGADNEQVDCYVGPQVDSNIAWVIAQNRPDTGTFDEHKIMFGYKDAASALKDYCAGFSDGSGLSRIGDVFGMDVNSIKSWMASESKRKFKDLLVK